MVKRFVALAGVFVVLLSVVNIFAAVVIHEIHYDPDVKTEPVEFIELHNNGLATDLSGWSFDQGIDYTFPAGTIMAPGSYLVVAEDPAALQTKFGVPALGPWVGGLSNDGETIRLVDPLGNTVSEVDYGRGFPWPVVGGPPGYSIELANPFLDPDLGGNWRASDANAGNGQTLVPEDDVWRYFKGISEASTPREAWRQPGFNDSAWASGPLAIGYGENFINTTLGDMQGNYRAVMLRKTFVVTNLATVGSLQLEVIVDDGFNAWINGDHVVSFNLPGTNVAFDANANSALENLDWQTFNVPTGAGLQLGTNVLAIQMHNANLGNSSDAVLNARLKSVGTITPGPTPNAANSVAVADLPPRVRQVKHQPKEPTSGIPVTISAKVTDAESGIDAVRLHYQVVDPGQYIALDDPAYASTWTVVAMTDPDGDSIYETVLPGSLQVHRRLLRYRVFATDNAGQVLQAPLANDPEPNFALFTYDGVPAWSGAVEPGVTAVQNFGTNVMASLPVYHLISKKTDVEDCTWFDTYTGADYRWSGTLVHDGEVYDHIGYRARGGVWRYAMGKNMWKFNFNTGHRLEARDDFGNKYGEAWDKLNFSSVIQQGNYWHRGEQGMFETAGFKLFDLMDVESPNTHFAHFRIIDEAAETGPTQFDGDFWGLYLAIEQLDGRFLDEHDLPDGNLYKMESGTGTLNNQGATAVSDRSDLDTFLNTYNNSTPTDQWWRDNLDLERYYGYRSVVEGIHHYDIAAGKNYFYYNNPQSGRWQVVPWDLDLTWGDNMFGNGNEPFKSRVITRPVFEQEYQNRLRSFRDLIYNGDEGHRLLDDIASLINDLGGALSFVDADRARWDHNPILDDPTFIDRFNSNKARTGRFYMGNGGSIMPPTPDFEGMVQQMKNYISSRGGWIDTNLLDDPAIPNTPVISYAGTPGFPLDQIGFSSSAFVDGSGSFQQIEWRVGEVTDPGAPGYDPDEPPVYEATEIWEAQTANPGAADLAVTLPPTLLQPGRTYRARVRHLDSTGKASHWSAPVEFTADGPISRQSLVDNLRISEVMYNSAAGGDFDFVEFVNTNAVDTLDLSNVQITDGISYVFPTGTLMPPGSYLVVAKLPGVAFDAA